VVGTDLQTDFGTEAAVEAELFLRDSEWRLLRVVRFKTPGPPVFKLVGAVIGDKHPGDVRLD
jgi:hypothetical protein